MFFTNALLVAVSFAAAGFAQLPAEDKIYHIVNRETGLRWDVRGSSPDIDTDIIGFDRLTGDNQKWNASRVATVGSSGIYTFTAIDPDLSAYVNGVPGNPLRVQVYKTPFNVTQVAADDQAFFITIPDIEGNPILAVTSPTSVPDPALPLTLQPLEPSNGLQVWTFEATTV
ncbi:hypothetical protein AURDEDRAFT_125936 [Auricularia subglabra TFB-10046 SS5]|nr:hypothetical protein AURDEDRAFT_125936 [Auricularia subglabra TFB-10046 SS5]